MKRPKSDERTSRISDDALPPIGPGPFSQIPTLISEFGDPFLRTGNIQPDTELPGDAAWQPSLLGFCTCRTADQAFHGDDDTASEWADRLDRFANFQLSGTEHGLLGIRPLDEDGRFANYILILDPIAINESGFDDESNTELTTALVEGDIDDLLLVADPNDLGSLDCVFSVVRQSLSFPEDMLINDKFGSVGIMPNILQPTGEADLPTLLIYVNALWDLDNSASVYREPVTGGPLRRTGILFSAVDLGEYRAALGSRVDQSVGAAIGYEMFLDDTHQQIIIESGERQNTESDGDGTVALESCCQQAIGQDVALQLDAFGSYQKSRDAGWGSCVAIRHEFCI